MLLGAHWSLLGVDRSPHTERWLFQLPYQGCIKKQKCSGKLRTDKGRKAGAILTPTHTNIAQTVTTDTDSEGTSRRGHGKPDADEGRELFFLFRLHYFFEIRLFNIRLFQL